MRRFVKRYRIFLLLTIMNIAIAFIWPEIGMKSFDLTRINLIDMLAVIPPIFILLGLLDV